MSLATYRAVYDLVLDKSDDSTDLADLNGRIVMEFTGSDCGGYSVALRFVTEIADPEGARRITDARTTTYEEGDGEQTPIYVMSFVLYENGVSRHLKIDYGDFAIVGRLSDLDMIPAKACPKP